ncbi:isoprenoid synthase domain-containing protein [Diaporthe sp. PMI_573]|nr:isoprenoid synthase domain-containing protein [Diaporthaceae sp. PMI_573]
MLTSLSSTTVPTASAHIDALETTATNLLSKIRGREILAPDLRQFYSGIKKGVNEHYKEIMPYVNGLLERVVSNERELEAAKRCDIAYFAACWYPHADIHRLKFIAAHAIFLFWWDDAIDRQEGSDTPELATSLVHGDEYRKQSYEFCKYHLGFSPELSQEPEPPTAATAIFAEVAKYIRGSAEPWVVSQFLIAVKEFMDGCREEQMYHLAGKFPTVQEYWGFRLRTSAVYTFCAVATYMAGSTLPLELLESTDMRNLWDELNRNIVLENDILSLKKEIIDGATGTMVPIIMQEKGYSLDKAMALNVKLVEESCEDFRNYTQSLRASGSSYDDTVQSQLEKVIEVFETSLTGCLVWSLLGARYGAVEDIQRDGSLKIKFA